MIKVENLEGINMDDLCSVFNLSFSDYFIPISLNQVQMEEKMQSENLNLKYSVGAFENGKLIAFILHNTQIINNKLVVYNGGTGVVPLKRGVGLVKQMYDFILPVLKRDKVEHIILEVLENNLKAIKCYNRIGFEVTGMWHCFKGKIILDNNDDNDVTIKRLDNYNWETLSGFWDFEPAWQNSIPVLNKLRLNNLSIGAYINDELVGYVVYNQKWNRVSSFGVAKNFRNQAIAQKLFDFISKNFSDFISVINIKENSITTLNFLKKIGLNNTVNQLEMKLFLSKHAIK